MWAPSNVPYLLELELRPSLMQMVTKRSIRANSTKVLGMERESLKKVEKCLKLIGLMANQMKKRS